jgi:tRNA(Ile)-lysidine synthetase-like protein
LIKIIKEIVSKETHHYVAVSMGVDSVSSLFWLRSKGYKITPLHFNHNLREQNHAMENKFHELCGKLGLKGIVGRGENLKTEKDCRDARLNFYKEVVDYEGYVITAHHLNDYVESYLINCFRGQPNHNPFELISEFDGFKIIHPFLLSKKKDFQEYVDRNKWNCYTVEDETNKVVKGSRRNWIRQTIVPEMKKQKLSLEKYCSRRIEKNLKNMKLILD